MNNFNLNKRSSILIQTREYQYAYTMSNQTQNTKDIQTKPTYQEVEQVLINVVKADIYYKKPKEGKFMQSYKERIIKLRQAEDPEEYIKGLAQIIFSNENKYNKIMNHYKEFYGRNPKIFTSIMELYKLYYNLAKDYFVKEAQIDKEAEDFLNL